MCPDTPSFRETPPAVDMAQLLERMDQDHEVALALMELFVEEHKDDAARLEALMQQQQQQAALHLVHTLKGVAGNLAAEALKNRAAAMETCLREGEPLRPEVMLPLREELQRTLAWIRRYLKPPL